MAKNLQTPKPKTVHEGKKSAIVKSGETRMLNNEYIAEYDEYIVEIMNILQNMMNILLK